MREDIRKTGRGFRRRKDFLTDNRQEGCAMEHARHAKENPTRRREWVVYECYTCVTIASSCFAIPVRLYYSCFPIPVICTANRTLSLRILSRLILCATRVYNAQIPVNFSVRQPASSFYALNEEPPSHAPETLTSYERINTQNSITVFLDLRCVRVWN